MLKRMASSALASDLCAFINASPSPFHVVREAVRRLESAGFQRVLESAPEWALQPGKKYYLTRGQSAFVAFAVGEAYVPGNGYTITAAHSDSPCLRVKPISKLVKGGYHSLGVETYGGGIWHTWFDRDLSVAGRVIVASGDGSYASRLVHIPKPILRVPSLAIHLDRTVNDSFKVNTETQLPPILATVVRSALEAPPKAAGGGGGGGSSDGAVPGTGGALDRHHAGLVSALATELGCPPEALHDFELCLYDTQPSTLGGLHEEFVFSPRLDNLCMTHATLEGLIASCSTLSGEKNVRIMASFNHEEVGSDSTPGAGSTLLGDLLARLCPGPPSLQSSAIRKSLLISADMAHALHPNHAGLHEENHRPAMHAGLVIKTNSNQRYATEASTAFFVRRVAEAAKVPLQDFCVRQVRAYSFCAFFFC